MSRFLASILFATVGTLPTAVAETKFDPESLAKTVAPYLDDRTLMVIHIDAARLDTKTAVRVLAQLFGSKVRDFEPVQERLDMLLLGFRKAGGTEFYIVLSLIDLHPNWSSLNAGPFLVAPVRGEGKELAAFFRQVGAAEKIGESIIAGPKTTLARLRKLQPVPRPELAKAFATAGGGAAQICLLPPTVLRRAIEETLPLLPEELGGGSIKELTRGCQWAVARIDAAPSVQVRLTLQATDADTAKALHSDLSRLLKALAKNEQIRSLFPNVEKAVLIATPEISGDRLTLARNESELTTLLQPILAPFAPPPRSDATVRLHKLLVALLDYENAQHHFPAAASYDNEGKPLLSWRVHILPYLGEEKLYKEFHLDEPWDSEYNKKLIGRMPAVFRSSENADLVKQGKTTFLAPLGNVTMFPDKRGLRISDVLDGTSNTIFLVDVEDSRAVVWTQPEDWRYDPSDPLKGLARRLKDKYIVGMVDSSVRLLQKTISKYTMQAAFTRNGGEVLGPDF